MGLEFNRQAAAAAVAQQVTNGVDLTTIRIQALAKSLAPVRKSTPHQTSRNRSAPLAVGLYKGRSRINNEEALGDIAAKLQISVVRLIQTINTGTNAETKSARDLRQRKLHLIRSTMDSLGINARLVRPQGRTAELKGEVRRLHGVSFDEETGGFVSGGTLRRSIHAVPAKRRGSKIVGRVLADAPYARWVEFPTHRTKAQPFMMPAFKAFGTAEQLAKATRR